MATFTCEGLIQSDNPPHLVVCQAPATTVRYVGTKFQPVCDKHAGEHKSGRDIEIPAHVNCDVCLAYSPEATPLPAVVDAKSKMHGRWAYMCIQHCMELAYGLGTGLGQRLWVKPLGAEWAANMSNDQLVDQFGMSLRASMEGSDSGKAEVEAIVAEIKHRLGSYEHKTFSDN